MDPGDLPERSGKLARSFDSILVAETPASALRMTRIFREVHGQRRMTRIGRLHPAPNIDAQLVRFRGMTRAWQVHPAPKSARSHGRNEALLFPSHGTIVIRWRKKTFGSPVVSTSKVCVAPIPVSVIGIQSFMFGDHSAA